jgi:hypothetical protein
VTRFFQGKLPHPVLKITIFSLKLPRCHNFAIFPYFFQFFHIFFLICPKNVGDLRICKIKVWKFQITTIGQKWRKITTVVPKLPWNYRSNYHKFPITTILQKWRKITTVVMKLPHLVTLLVSLAGIWIWLKILARKLLRLIITHVSFTKVVDFNSIL